MNVLLLMTALCLLIHVAGSAAETPLPRPAVPAEKDRPRHDGFVAIAKAGQVDLLFIGDSITDGWRDGQALAIWNKYFAPFKAANFGIGGDRTEHVLWRLQNGELEGISPKLAVLMIGTNNASALDAPADVALGIKAILAEFKARSPKTKILLLGIFPRGVQHLRESNDQVNKIIRGFADGKHIVYGDIGVKLVKPDQSMDLEIMPDQLHLSPKGYQIWADAIADKVKEMMR
jgi:N-acetylglucosamine-6-sulfatase